MPTLQEVVTFTATEATAEDLDRIFGAINLRRKALASVRAANVTKGAGVKLTNLTPKALNGLTGEVTEIAGERCTVLLDTKSTATLAYGRTKFAYPASSAPDGRYTLNGVPLSCCEVQ
jgi:hypothetical protein